MGVIGGGASFVLPTDSHEPRYTLVTGQPTSAASTWRKLMVTNLICEAKEVLLKFW